LPPASVALRDTCDSYASPENQPARVSARQVLFWGIFGRAVVTGAERRSGLGDDLLDQLAQVLRRQDGHHTVIEHRNLSCRLAMIETLCALNMFRSGDFPGVYDRLSEFSVPIRYRSALQSRFETDAEMRMSR
jgi:hypothetical protein